MMRKLVEALASDACAGRAAGTEGGKIARRLVLDALRGAGLDPFEQPVPSCRGANVLATIPGAVERWVRVAAHYDPLCTLRGAGLRPFEQPVPSCRGANVLATIP